ncbi:MAG TPA: PAS domain S-box protein [Verrucomicrobiae bacterium]|nr:PAS domain S-box protein [Verrucomicrobiae bacterium]
MGLNLGINSGDATGKEHAVELAGLEVRTPLSEGEGGQQPHRPEPLTGLPNSQGSILTETLPAVIFIHRDGRLVYVNSTTDQILGYSNEELLRMNFWDLAHPECREWVRARGLGRQQGYSVPARYSCKAVTKSGQERWLECSGTQISYGGQPAVLGCAFDITERVYAEERLSVQYRLAQILGEAATLREAAPRFLEAIARGLAWNYGALWTTDPGESHPRCRATWHSGEPELAAFEAVGQQEHSGLATGLPALVWIEQRAIWIPDVRVDRGSPRVLAAAKAGLRSAAAFPITVESRSVGVVEFFARAHRVINDELLLLMAAIGPQIGQYLERKRTEEALRETEKRFALFMQHLPGAAWMKDVEGRYLYANGTAERIFRIRSSDLCGRVDEEVFPPQTAAQFKQNDRTVIQSGQSLQVIETLGQEDGIHHSIVSKFPILNDDGVPILVGGVSIDITERVKAERLGTAFSELGRRLSMASTRLEAARMIVEIAAEILGWDACYLHLGTPQSGQFLPVLTIDTIAGKRVDIAPAPFTPDLSPMMRRVMEEGAQLVERGATPTPAGLVPFGDVERLSASMMYVPIHTGSKVIGILSIQSYRPGAYQAEDLKTLQALADHGGGALQRIHMAEALHEMEAQNLLLLNAIPDLMFRIRKDGTLVDCRIRNDAKAASHFQGQLGRNLTEILPGRAGRDAMVHVQRTLEQGAATTFEFQYPEEDPHDYEARIQVVSPDEVLVIVRDFSEQTRLEREVLSVSAQERQSIGKDLHDGLGQLLTGLGFLAKALEEKLGAKGLAETKDAAQISQFAVQALTQARDLARGLYPVELECNGLQAALRDLAASAESLYGISCSLHCDSTDLTPARPVQAHLYRLVQEAISNAIRHGKARAVSISLMVPEPHQMLLVVRDNGLGFAQCTGRSSGMGLRTMQYRARAIRGELNVQSSPQGGTIVTCRFPV